MSIEVKNLLKVYREQKAVNNIFFIRMLMNGSFRVNK